jgi:hypothetical protein
LAKGQNAEGATASKIAQPVRRNVNLETPRGLASMIELIENQVGSVGRRAWSSKSLERSIIHENPEPKSEMPPD